MEEDARAIATAYLDSWKARDFATLRGLLADHVTFRGVLGATDGVKATLAGLEGMARVVADFRVRRMVAEGDGHGGWDVMTWYDFHTTVCDPMPTVNWSHVENGRITAIRAVFDPRPLLAAQGA